MRWLIALGLVAVPLTCLVPAVGFGQGSFWPSNTIGVFFDPGAWTDCSSASPYTTVTAYLLAVDVADPNGISGWEASLVTDPATFPAGVSIQLQNGGTNALTAPEFDVTLPAPVPRAGVISLATWSTFYLGGVISLGLGPAHPGHFPDCPGPGYAGGADPTERARLVVDWNVPVSDHADTYWSAGVNGAFCSVDGREKSAAGNPCQTPVRQESWGTIKELYR